MQFLRLIIALTFVFIGLSLARAAGDERPKLRDKVELASEIVRIGDLIENAGVFADIAIFRAPDLGQTGTVEARTVLAAARRHGLDMVDARGLSEVAVTRLSHMIDAAEIERNIAAAVAGRAGLGNVESISVSVDREVAPVHVETGASLKLARSVYDTRASRFDVTFEVVGTTSPRRRFVRYTGIAAETVEVAVLTRSISRGDVIRADDIVVERRPKAAASGNAIGQADQLVGMAAKRQIPASQPIRSTDLMRPELVRQNEPVTVVYEAPGISLSMRGKALESGAEGDTVNVLNVRTKRTMHGIVTGPGRISIETSVPQIAAGKPEPARSVAANSPQQRTE